MNSVKLPPLLEEEDVRKLFCNCGAVWKYEKGDPPCAPHAKVNGSCFNEYYNTKVVLRSRPRRSLLSQQVASQIRRVYLGGVDWVISSSSVEPEYTLRVAEILGSDKCGRMTLGRDKQQVWEGERIRPGSVIVQVEEFIPSRRKVIQSVRTGIRASTGFGWPGMYAPVIGTIVAQKDAIEFGGVPILALARHDPKIWPTEQCPLCKTYRVDKRKKGRVKRRSMPLDPITHWRKLIKTSALP